MEPRADDFLPELGPALRCWHRAGAGPGCLEGRGRWEEVSPEAVGGTCSSVHLEGAGR